MTNCPNCGAVREPAERRCPYCGTPYPKDRKAAEAVAVPVPGPEAVGNPATIYIKTSMTIDAIEKAVRMGCITPNDARRLYGLREL